MNWTFGSIFLETSCAIDGASYDKWAFDVGVSINPLEAHLFDAKGKVTKSSQASVKTAQ